MASSDFFFAKIVQKNTTHRSIAIFNQQCALSTENENCFLFEEDTEQKEFFLKEAIFIKQNYLSKLKM